MSDETPGGGSPFEQPDFSSYEEDGADELEVEDDDDLVGDPNAAIGGSRAAAVLEHVARSIADDKEAVTVEERESRGQLRLDLRVAPQDMGRVIGRRGRTAQALRTLVRAAAAADGKDAFVDIVD